MAGNCAATYRRRISRSNQSKLSLQDLEDDLLVEILSRTPTARSAIHCKLVCKRWCSLISSPYFIKTFMDIHNQYHDQDKPLGLLLTHLFPAELHFTLTKFCKNPIFNFRAFSLARYLPEGKEGIIVVASCNDLILCQAGLRCKNKSYYLCNPFTKQWVALPPPSSVYANTGHYSKFGLICERGGVINSVYRYRVVRFYYHEVQETAKRFAAETFYSETREWVKSELLGKEFRFASDIVAYDGKLHWVGEIGNFIVSYDPFKTGSSCISLMHGPNFNLPNDGKMRFHVAECKGVLRLTGLRNRHLHVWDVEKMGGGDDDNDSSNERRLSLKHNADFETIISRQEAKTHSFAFLTTDFVLTTDFAVAAHPMNNDVLYLYSQMGNFFAEYNMESGEMKVKEEGQFYYWKYRSNFYLFYPLMHPWWPTQIFNPPPHSSQS